MSAHDPVIRIQHMRDAAREVVEFTTGKKREDLDEDQMLLRALSMSTGIIGEAAAQVDPDIRNKYEDIPWKQVVGMRNFLFHEYFRVDPDILWDTATKSIPPLIPQLDSLLSELQSDDEEME